MDIDNQHNEQPLLSVIVPVYNVEQYLEKCLESITKQTYNNLEIILVDDGATDLSGKICDKWAKLDKRIRVLHKKNGGLSDARNVGLDICCGELITFVDSDDYLMLDMYSSMIEAFQKYQVDIVVCGDFFVDENTKEVRTANVHELKETEVLDRQNALNELCLDSYIVSHAWDKIYRREVIINTRFPVGHNYEDIYVMHSIFKNARGVAHINQPKYFYIQRKGSIVKTPSIKNQKDLLNAYITRYRDVCQDVNDSIKWAQLENIIEVLSVTSQYYPIRMFREVIEFLLGETEKYRKYYKLSKKKQIKFLFEKANLNYLLKPTKIKEKLKRTRLNDIVIRKKEKEYYKSKRTNIDSGDIYLLGIPEYGNIGDQAIAEAEYKFIKDVFPGKKIVQITENALKFDFQNVKRRIADSALLVLQGGGNIGNLWPDQEAIRKRILDSFPDNKILIMPQTVTIKGGEKENNEILRKYDGKNIWITVREDKSYNYLKQQGIYERTLLIPDIVLSLKPQKICRERQGIGVCLRNDIESAISYNDRVKILNILASKNNTKLFDTVLNKHISLEERSKVINEFLEYISQFELIVTDRLHCMILAYLTNTPCIVFQNSNGKVAGVYEWIKDCNFVKCCNIEEVSGTVEDLRKIESFNESEKLKVISTKKLKKLILQLYL